ncbi:MAG: Crp/Fnr family transcriptional regulator [Rhodocyclaceae bacterium]|nr:Crp/Fnr family transcriptional regulator [Rhodocyclaceae bacterium]
MKNIPSDIPGTLGRLPLFQELASEQIAAVAAGVREKRLGRGEMLFQKGDPARGFFVILNGQIKLAFPSAQGNEKVVEILGPRQSFGEAVMFMDRPYPVFAEALTEATLLFIDQTVVYDLLKRDASFARKLLAGLSRRLHGLVHDVESYSLRSSVQRVIGYLLQHCPEDTGGKGVVELTLPTSKQVIASRLNLTPETLSRVFHDLTERGLIQVSGKVVSIVNVNSLREFDL